MNADSEIVIGTLFPVLFIFSVPISPLSLPFLKEKISEELCMLPLHIKK